MLRKKLVLVICLAGGAFLGEALALEPAPLKLMGGEFTPTITMAQRYHDNYLYQSADETATGEFVLSSKMGVDLQRSNTRFTGGVALDIGRYTENDADDYEDYGATAQLASELTLRNLLQLNFSVLNNHEARGTGYSEGRALVLDEPDTLRHTRYGVKYRYGADTAKGRAELEAYRYEREFTSRRQVTADRNYTSPGVRAALFLRMGGRADALIEVRQAKTEYDTVSSDQPLGTYNSSNETYYVGVGWGITGKSEGSVRIGQVVKDFDSPLREDDTSISWEVSASWLPKTYSKFTLTSSREPQETYGTGNYIDAQVYGLDWEHQWSPKMRTTLGVDYRDEDYIGSGLERSEALTALMFSADYAFRRWFDLGFTVRASDKTATIDQYEYSANMAEISASWSL